MQVNFGLHWQSLRVDGSTTTNHLPSALQADIFASERPAAKEVTALSAVHLAGTHQFLEKPKRTTQQSRQ